MRRIQKVAVIGSGIMGTGIACHLANIGLEVLLLDMATKEIPEALAKKKLALDHPLVRNFQVNTNLQKALTSNPSPVFDANVAQQISTATIDFDLEKIANCDWIIEVIVENLTIKKELFEKIDQYRTKGTLISSNTSGIPINLMSEGRSDDFKQHFCGTHFFNPARYLKLLEIIPTNDTLDEVTQFHMEYGSKFLGKTTVLCKDTPAFIGNRIGIYSMMNVLHNFKKLGLSVSAVDHLSGAIIGRPKSATFRTADLVGLDTLVHVANGLYQAVPNDEQHDLFALPEYLQEMMQKKWLGDKTKQGFYKKTVDENGNKKILELNTETFEYEPTKRNSYPTYEILKNTEDLKQRYALAIKGKDVAAQFYQANFGALFAYASNRIPEIANEFYKIDDAMQGGFGWKHGPFEIWDAIGLEKGLDLITSQGFQPAQWIEDMKANSIQSFYTINEQGSKCYYDIQTKKHIPIPGQEDLILLDNIRDTKTIWSNTGGNIIDLGEGVYNIEFRSKMNTIGAEVLQLINKGIDLAENQGSALVISNEGENFSVGANLMMVFMLAAEQEYDELNFAIKYFQDTMMRLRYCAVPTIAAPHNMTFGGGCELCLHTDKVVAHAETYIGLVEFGVGVIPGGGGSKEMALRALENSTKGDVETNRLLENFMTIATAKVATSAKDAFNLGIFKEGKDSIIMNKTHQLTIAKKEALLMVEKGYTPPPKKQVKVLGKQALGMFKVGIDAMQDGRYISEHDNKIAQKLAYVMAGGDLSESTLVNEEYLLTIEREAFLSLLTEKKTLERIQNMLKTGKPLRN